MFVKCIKKSDLEPNITPGNYYKVIDIKYNYMPYRFNQSSGPFLEIRDDKGKKTFHNSYYFCDVCEDELRLLKIDSFLDINNV